MDSYLNYDEEKRYSGSNDILFKSLFKDKELVSLYLKYFTDIDVKAEDIKETNIEEVMAVDKKGIRMDLRFEILNNTSVDLEFQNVIKSEKAFERRMVHYLSTMYTYAFSKGSEYNEDKEAVLVVFINDEATSFKPLMKFTLCDKKNNVEKKYLQMYFINIPKYLKDFNKKSKDDIIKMKLLDVLVTDNGEKYKNDKSLDLRKIERRINEMNREGHIKLSMFKAAYYEAEQEREKKEAREEGLAEGIAEGKAQGIAEGSKANLIENIKTMKSNGLSNEDIAKYLSLDLKYVNEVLKEQK